MISKVVKRNGEEQNFDFEKIKKAVNQCYISKGFNARPSAFFKSLKRLFKCIDANSLHVEEIQDIVENWLMDKRYYDIARAYIKYRDQHTEDRLIQERVDYMDSYMNSAENASTSSEEDANANVTTKNVANLDSEVYKKINRRVQRYRMEKRIAKLYPEVEKQYEKDIDSHIIYIHDEASTPVIKNYCEAVTLYPLLINGTSSMDGLKTTPPKNLNSFCGQLVNLTFTLSAQCKGAVAFGEFFNFLDYFCAKDFGEDYPNHYNDIASVLPKRTILESIHQAYQQIVYGWNQPAGNRGFQSPFVNISYYDSNYWHSLFDDFAFPDGTKPVWERVSFLQKDFMQWFNKERTKTLLTFPVETMALLHDGKDVIDKDYKQFTAKMWAEGHSFFLYLSDSPDSLASCCRLRNKINSNVFSFTNGLTGVQTGSCNVITLNINRITQDCYRAYNKAFTDNKDPWITFNSYFKSYFTSILQRVVKYHVAYKSLLYDVEKKGMLTASKAGYISMKKLYSTIGINGFNEAAEFLDIPCRDNESYRGFAELVLGTIDSVIKEANKLDPKYQFNCEFVPAESLGGKNYAWDKADGYKVPEGNNLYNSYFFKTDSEDTDVIEKLALHGSAYTKYLSGGVGCHINLEDHLDAEQYSKLIVLAIKFGTSYFTFNIPNCECDKCGHIEKHHFDKCPVCGSTKVTDWTRVIGYMRPIKTFPKPREFEASRRVYTKKEVVNEGLNRS